MWNIILGVNSFVVMPIVTIFFLYSIGRAFLTWDWKLVVIAFILLALGMIAEVVLGALSE
jgi:hypothetical protein